jgi:hypothetical protein
MSPSAAPMNVYPCEVASVRIQADPSAPNGACETDFEIDKWSIGWFGPISERISRSKNAAFAGILWCARQDSNLRPSDS